MHNSINLYDLVFVHCYKHKKLTISDVEKMPFFDLIGVSLALTYFRAHALPDILAEQKKEAIRQSGIA